MTHASSSLHPRRRLGPALVGVLFPLVFACGTDGDDVEAHGPLATLRGGLSAVATADAASKAGALPSCPSFGSGVATGRLASSALTEASGVVEGRRTPGVLWTHNDSGANPRVYAVATSGATLAMYDLDGAKANDWEDIAIGPGPVAGQSYLYVGDIGDNSTSRSHIDVYRVAEPDVRTGSPTTPKTLTGVERIRLRYPDGAHNAETLLVDPLRGDLYLVVKSKDGTSPVFRAAAPLSTSATSTLDKVATLHFGSSPLSGDKKATGGDISPAGDEIALRTYDAAYLFRRPAGSSVAQALSTAPCRLPLASEPQGEALGFSADGHGYYTVSEGRGSPIYYYARR